jgi:hypothetical protein
VFAGEYHDALSVSPDGRRVAFGMSAPGANARVGVGIVDLTRLRFERGVETGIASEGLAWLTDRQLVAALQRGGIVVIDPATGAILRRWRGWHVLRAVTTRTRRSLVMLEADGQTSRLAAVDATGDLRSVRLPVPARDGHGSRLRPALVADPAAERVYVLPGGRTVLAVDLARMRVHRHRLRSGLGSAEPSGRFAFRDRDAVWLGAGRLALAGTELRRRPGPRLGVVPVPVSLIDSRTWTVRTIDASATGVTLARGRLLAYGPRGVRAYSLRGRRLFETLGRRRVWSVAARGGIAYATSRGRTHVIDTGTGRVRRTIRRALEVRALVARRCPG